MKLKFSTCIAVQRFAFGSFLTLMISVNGYAQDDSKTETTAGKELQRSDFVSDASFVVGTYQPKVEDQSEAAMAEAGKKFFASLDSKQQKAVSHGIDSKERREWTNLPAPPGAGGLRLGDMNEKQIKAACDLLRTILSEQGYKKIINIMLADDQLLRNGQARSGFGTENFSIVLFATPDESHPWALQIDGHHVGVNVSIGDNRTTVSPSFIGTQPHVFKLATTNIEPLKNETSLAYQLVNSLNREQALQALVAERRGAIVSGPGNDGKIPSAKGIPCSSFDDNQKQQLMGLISQWVGDMREVDAKRRMQQLEKEIDQMHFAWYGPTKDNSDISYAIQGPTLIIEYACQDLGGNPIDHLHTMYRDPTNEYGGQLDESDK